MKKPMPMKKGDKMPMMDKGKSGPHPKGPNKAGRPSMKK